MPDAHLAVAELAELLAFDSPLSGEARGHLIEALQVLFEAARNDFQDVPGDKGLVFPPERGQWVQVQVKSIGRRDLVQSGSFLDQLLTTPGMDLADREALKGLVRAALHFGEQAVLRYDAEHPDGGEEAGVDRAPEKLAGDRERHDAGR